MNDKVGYIYFMSSVNIRYSLAIGYLYSSPYDFLYKINNEQVSLPNLRRYFFVLILKIQHPYEVIKGIYKYLDHKHLRIHPKRNIFKCSVFNSRKLCYRILKLRPQLKGKMIYDLGSKLNLLEYERLDNNNIIVTNESDQDSSSSCSSSDSRGYALIANDSD